MSRPDSFRIGLVQHACGDSTQANTDRCIELIRQAAEAGARLVVTPELFTTRYFPQAEDPAAFDLAEPVPGPTTQRLGELAAQLGIYISASLFEKRAAGLYHNSSVMIGPDGAIVQRYRKMHIPDDPGFFEKFYFTPGDQEPGWAVAPAGQVRAGMLICWDQWFPEAARLSALRGAEVLLYPTAIAWSDDEPEEEQQRQREAWITVQRSHAIANGVFICAVNRVGREGALRFWGSSFVADPGGTILAQGDTDSEQALVVDCDLARIEQVRRMWPFLRDRRVDAYADLGRRYGD